MDVLSAVLIAIAICTALFADTLDRKFSANGSLRKVLLVCSIGVVCICLIPLLWSVFV